MEHSESQPAALVLGAATTLLLAPVCRKIAISQGLVSQPRPDRWSQSPTPLLGGLAIMSGVTLASSFSPGRLHSLPLLCGAWTAFALGLRDDRAALGPPEKIAGLCVARSVEYLVGRLCREPFALPAAITGLRVMEGTAGFLICLAGPNALNLVDNMDGLAVTLAAVSSSASASLSPGALAAGLAGSCLGLLVWNAPEARIFMGDSGSLPVGYLLSRLACQAAGLGSGEGSRWRKLGVVFLLLAAPAIDSAYPLARRVIEHRPVFRGDTDHLSHTLARAGLREPGPVLLLQGLQVLAVAGAIKLAGKGQDSCEQRSQSPALLLFATAAAVGVLLQRAWLMRRRAVHRPGL